MEKGKISSKEMYGKNEIGRHSLSFVSKPRNFVSHITKLNHLLCLGGRSHLTTSLKKNNQEVKEESKYYIENMWDICVKLFIQYRYVPNYLKSYCIYYISKCIHVCINWATYTCI